VIVRVPVRLGCTDDKTIYLLHEILLTIHCHFVSVPFCRS
jgi:hypothetical protein